MAKDILRNFIQGVFACDAKYYNFPWRVALAKMHASFAIISMVKIQAKAYFATIQDEEKANEHSSESNAVRVPSPRTSRTWRNGRSSPG
ncbi:hypothetical protein BMEII0615 [Brucella melitensis bv. 1 str. 16M]|uniref:Uncharacterized protein n=1 Tax=Brucella melitensis biotype 1 (strain ATCC 23456 / CCUG 17765 / NCTC 10094 / 16M) TaxID=224914 RepID=Q8YCB7_BRUME|nr:hypothetical protein BMEII0615 [Brucella melitensis bv. 1 str. 16M]